MNNRVFGHNNIVDPRLGRLIVDHISGVAEKFAKEAENAGEVDWSTFTLEVGKGVWDDPFDTGTLGIRVRVEVKTDA